MVVVVEVVVVAYITWSSAPQNQAAPLGAPGMAGRSLRRGKLLELGSNCILAEVLVAGRVLEIWRSLSAAEEAGAIGSGVIY